MVRPVNSCHAERGCQQCDCDSSLRLKAQTPREHWIAADVAFAQTAALPREDGLFAVAHVLVSSAHAEIACGDDATSRSRGDGTGKTHAVQPTDIAAPASTASRDPVRLNLVQQSARQCGEGGAQLVDSESLGRQAIRHGSDRGWGTSYRRTQSE